MTTLTEVLSNMRLQEEKESVIQNSINKLNNRTRHINRQQHHGRQRKTN